MTEPLEAVTIADEVTPENPSPLEQEAAKGEDFSLKSFRKAQEKAEKAELEAPPLEVVPEPEVKDIGAEPVKAEPVRDEQGRFVKPEAAKAEPAPAADEDDETKPPKNLDQFHKRLDRLRRGREADQAALRAERAARERLEQDLAALKPPPVAAPAPKPAETFPTYDDWLKHHDGATYEDYLDARAEEKVDRKLTAERQRLEADQRTRATEQALQRILDQGSATHADFEATITAATAAGIQWAPHVTAFVLQETDSLEEAVSLSYALAKDHALVQRLNRLPPGRASYELGKVAAALSASPAAAPGPAQTPPGTRAPAPIVPVGAGRSASPVTPESLVRGSEISLKKLRAVMERDS